MFFCTKCEPKVKLALKFFTDIQQRQQATDNKLKQLEEKLSKSISNINTSIVSLTETTNSLQSSTKSVKQSSAMEQEASETTKVASTTGRASIRDSSQQDRKFNVVIYGIDECNKGTPRHE